jgi:hypothetical protein
MFGSFMHQQWSLPGGAPQLNLVPHSSQVSFSIPTFLADVEKNAASGNGKPQACLLFLPDTTGHAGKQPVQIW